MNAPPWQNAQRLLDILYSLSYRTGDLQVYLQTIADGVSELLGIDWSVVTFCEDGTETVMASSIDMGERSRYYPLHGRLTGYVVATGQTLIVDDVEKQPEYGRGPAGYRSYLGIPLRTPQGTVIGSICSFHRTARPYSEAEVRIVEMFAERAAIALDNFHLYERERNFHASLETEILQRTEQLRSAQAKLVERERLAAIGEFAASIVHEIRNPLTTVSGVLRYFRRQVLPAAAQERLALALEESARLERLLSEILLYAKPQVLRLHEVDLTQLVQEVIDSLRTQGQRVRFDDPGPVRVLGDRDKLKQALINIGLNAAQAVTPTEPITWQLAVDGQAQVELAVHNGGEPIAPADLPRVTEPFFSTKPAGTGLGLAIVRRIVEAHGGELHIRSNPAEGTTICIRLRATD